jgi:hypothetical protein
MIHFLDFKNNFQFFFISDQNECPIAKSRPSFAASSVSLLCLLFLLLIYFLSSFSLSVFLSSHISVIALFLLSLKIVVASWQRRIGFHFYFCLFVDLFADMFLLVVFETHLSWPSFMNIWRRLHSYFLNFLGKEKHISS